MRSAIGGCVENILETAFPSNGDSIQICAMEFDFWCTTVESRSNTSNALRKPAGFLVNATAVASASDSRLREIADFKSTAAIGAKIRIRSEKTKSSGLPSREIFEATGAQVTEMPPIKDPSFCCGAGGGRM